MFRPAVRGTRRRRVIVVLVTIGVLTGIVPQAALGQATPDPQILNHRPPDISPQPEADPGFVASLGDPRPADMWENGKEVPELRTLTTKTFRGEVPGLYRDRVYTGPVHFKDANNKWADIDEILMAPAEGKRKNKANRFGLWLAEQGSNRSLATLSLDTQHSVGFGFDGASDVRGTFTSNAVTYRAIKKAVDVRLVSLKNGVKEEIVLSSAEAGTRFLFPLQLRGLTASIDDRGDVVYRDASGKERARTPRGYMFDSSKDARTGMPALSDGVSYALVPDGNGTALEVRVDAEWISSADRVWPITVDPAIYTFTDPDDTFVVSGFSTTNFSTHTELWVGTYNGGTNKANSYLHFNTMNLYGKSIAAAYLVGSEKASTNCGLTPGPVYRVLDETWQAGSIAGYPGPDVDLNTAGVGSWYSGTCNVDRVAVWNIGSIVQRWANSGSGHGSLSLRAHSYTDTAFFKSYRSFESGYPMYLQVDWSSGGNPFGYLDNAVQYQPGYGNGQATLFARGWMIDPDTTQPTTVGVYNALTTSTQPATGVSVLADKDRPDVGTNYPAYGSRHGYETTLPTNAGPGTYTVCVAGPNTAGSGSTTWLPCQGVVVVNRPNEPQNVAVEEESNGTLQVTWTAPPENGGASITGYKIDAIKTDGSVAGTRTCSSCSSVNFGTTHGLISENDYKFKVYARNAMGDGLPAETNTVKFLGVIYSALGDSYSSGQGADERAEAPEDDEEDVFCKRSPEAYGPVYRDMQPTESRLQFLACAGAVTGDERSPAQNTGELRSIQKMLGDGGQLSRLNPNANFITLTIGGNDVGFSDVLKGCFLNPVDACNDEYGTEGEKDLAAKIDAMAPILADVYSEILDGGADADLVVLTYPYPVTMNDNCWSGYTVTEAELKFMRDKTDQMNNVIGNAATAVVRDPVSRLKVLDVRGSFERDDVDRGMCGEDGERYMNGGALITNNSFHPTTQGYAKQASELKELISAIPED